MPKSNKDKFDYRKALKFTPTPGMNKLKYIDVYLNRPVAALIVRAIYNTRITPNGVSVFSLFLGLLGAFFFSRGEYQYFVLGGVFAQLSSVVDGADGMLARAKNMCSDFGSHLDLFFDRIIDFSLFVGMSLGAGSYYNDKSLLLLGLLAAGLYMLQINLFYLTKSYLEENRTGETGEFRALVMWAMLILAVVNRLDILTYLGLAATVIINGSHLIQFIRLAPRKSR
ncbi:MAG: CDP-alcohol phosphatidyltransferase family protein [bacterium]|nr:CDP-alcohol phosphatidyltransferase family protein [bacterium]